MRRFEILLVAICAPICVGTYADSLHEDKRFLAMDRELIPLHSPEGRRLLKESTSDEAYWQLSQFYVPQPDLGSCGVASCLMVLNALPIDRPVSKLYAPYPFFTPDNFFPPEVEAIATRAKVSDSGMSLEQLSRVLATHPVSVERVFASNSSVEEFRKRARTILAKPDHYIIVNYLRTALGQKSGGHISPLAAYHEKSDTVLVLDVANFKYPWSFVSVNRLWKAMSEAIDSESQKSRGYVVITPK
jgi:hypothetical protein